MFLALAWHVCATPGERQPMAARATSRRTSQSQLRFRGHPERAPNILEVVLALMAWYYLWHGGASLLTQLGLIHDHGREGISNLAPHMQSWLDGLFGIQASLTQADMTGQILMQVPLTVLLFVWALRIRRYSRNALGVGELPQREARSTLVFMGLLSGGVFALITLVMLAVAWMSPGVFNQPIDMSAPEVLYWTAALRDLDTLSVISFLLLYPVMEEIWFRGWLYSSLRQSFGPWTTIIATALLFGFAHPTAILIPVSQLIGGVVFGYAYERTRNIAVPIILHMLGNGALVLISWWLASALGIG